MTYPVFQYAVDLNVSLSIGRDPSAFLNVSTVCLWESHLPLWQKFAILTTLSLQLSFKLSLITLGVKLSPISSFALHTSNPISVWHSESDQIPVPTAHINSPLLPVLPPVDTCAIRTIPH